MILPALSLEDINQRLESRTARIAVIGLGYVGLPVACEFARTGFEVLGVELRAERVEMINAGISPIEGEEPGLAELLAEVIRSRKLRATTDYNDLSLCEVILIDVETPVDKDNRPRYEALRSVLGDLGPVLQPGALVIVESTIAPGTMDGLVRPLLEEHSGMKLNEGFFLGNCPERVMPGKLLSNLRGVSRVVGGMTPETAETMVNLYRTIVKADLDPTDCVTAEIVKTAENAYRDVQIAFANEVALICEAVGGDVWKVRDLVNKSPGRQMHLPGAGVGGHCIPKDPWLLAYGAEGKDTPVRLIPAARAINDGMPLHMAKLLKEGLQKAGKTLEGSRILILGYAYLEDSDDTRNSPSEVLVEHLKEAGADVVVHDPYIPEFQGDIMESGRGCAAALVMVNHKDYADLDIGEFLKKNSISILIDGRNTINLPEGLENKIIFSRIGVQTDNQY
jgi:UDP-N-acetyl-D-mannosaminuronic acid dehydrogenase